MLKIITLLSLLLTSPLLLQANESDWSYYRNRYPLYTPLDKLMNNHGEGNDLLYGTRNLRVVLHGVFYRGGANNKWHRQQPRDNRNPLPHDGLGNLCLEGFSTAIYLYTRNFTASPRTVRCASRNAQHRRDRTLSYQQISPFAGPDHLNRILAQVYRKIMDRKSGGPIYSHCWNGWHASGYVAAVALRQFCSLSADDAVRYWDLGTDGHNKNRRYKRIRAKIRAFRPKRRWQISKSMQAQICPQPWQHTQLRPTQ